MSLGRARAIAYGVVALFGVTTVAVTKPLPPRLGASRAAAEPGPNAALRERHDTLGRRETLVAVLGRSGMPATSARAALRLVDGRTVHVGMPVHTLSGVADPEPTEIAFKLAVDRILHVRRTAEGWTSAEEALPWTTDTIVLSGVVTTHLYAAMDAAAARELVGAQRDILTDALAGLYEFRVDMNRDLRKGDAFTVVAERLHGPENTVRVGRIVAASMTLSGTTIDAVRFRSARAPGEYFDAEGRPLRSGFLRNPLPFGRMTSRFGLRLHPILGTMRRHVGTDYGAPVGTPIRAVGDGVVRKAEWGNGYGNMVEIRHPNGFITRYGHMRRFETGIRTGRRITVGSTIGYVGSTGLSTGPHLHFEVLVNGVQRDPRQALRNVSSDPIPAAERSAFASARMQAQAMLRPLTRFASADSSTADSTGARRANQQ